VRLGGGGWPYPHPDGGGWCCCGGGCHPGWCGGGSHPGGGYWLDTARTVAVTADATAALETPVQ